VRILDENAKYFGLAMSSPLQCLCLCPADPYRTKQLLGHHAMTLEASPKNTGVQGWVQGPESGILNTLKFGVMV